MKAPAVLLAVTTLALAAGCHQQQAVVVVYTSVDQVFSEPVLQEFAKRTGTRVNPVFDTEETKSTGILNRIIAEAASPRADVFWSNDPIRSLVLVRRGLVQAYRSPAAAGIPASFKAPDGSWIGFSARARVLLVNTRALGDLRAPSGILDYTDPRFRGRAAIANPAFGTTTVHLAALFTAWGEQKARRFLDELRRNQVRLASSNGEVKRLVENGEVIFGLVDTDDAAVALANGSPVKVIYPDQEGLGTLLLPTTVVMIKGAPHPEAGRRLIDFLVSADSERLLAFAPCRQIPLRPGVPVPAGMRTPDHFKTMKVDYGRLAEALERIHPLLRDWAEGQPAGQPAAGQVDH